jgi:hypothetical protein
MKPTLLTPYKANDLDKSWLPFLMNRYQTYNLPTEVVVREPGFFTPKQGRIYRTNLWATNLPGRELVLERSELLKYAKKLDKNLHDVGEEVFMVEQYSDRGDDGHTDMELTSYVFVRQSGLELVERYGRKEFAYVEVLWQRECAVRMAAAVAENEKPWTCEICGHGAEVCDGLHLGEGFQ